MKNFVFSLLIGVATLSFAQQNQQIKWLGKTNWILNPGAEANDNSLPINWKTDFKESGESNWVSAYGVTSHEWNSGGVMLGLPKNAGNNYFRLNVNNHEGTRKINLYQEFSLAELTKYLETDTVIATFSCQIASNSFLAENCSFAEVRLIYTDDVNHVIDTLIFRRFPAQFRDLDANTPQSIDRGFSVMHEFQAIQSSRRVSPKAKNLRVEMYCEFPCYIKFEEDQSPELFSNTFFFDNLMLGFYSR